MLLLQNHNSVVAVGCDGLQQLCWLHSQGVLSKSALLRIHWCKKSTLQQNCKMCSMFASLPSDTRLAWLGWLLCCLVGIARQAFW